MEESSLNRSTAATSGEPGVDAAPRPAKVDSASRRPANAPAESQPESEHDERDDASDPFWLRRTLRQSSALFISALAHMVGLVALGLMTVPEKVFEEVQEVVAEMLEEVPQEMQVVEIENQIVEVREVSSEVSSSPLAGAVGAAGSPGSGLVGAGGLMSAPQMDQALLEQAASTDVDIGGVMLDIPSSSKLVVHAPDGTIGDARAVVDSYEEALDRLTQEILWMMEKGKVLVVWNFDQSESMKNDQKEIRERIDHVYRQLGLLGRGQNDSLETAVTSYGEKWINHSRKPTADLVEIRAAIDAVPNDKSGKEMMCQAVGQSVSTYKPYCQKTGRQMALIILTDESGDRDNNNQYLEAALAEAKAARCKVYVLGREAVFGYPYAHIHWVHPQTGRDHWIQIDRGPETAFVEQLQTDGFRRRYDAHSSGFGPYECSRLGRDTNGIFFMLPSVETDLVGGRDKRRYALEAMRSYMPDLRSRLEVKKEIDESPLRSMLENVIYQLNPYNEEAAKIIVMRIHFSPNYPTFVEQARREQAKALIYLDYLARVEKTIAAMERLRREEASPRWQANYDIMYAQVIAYQARMYEYGAYLEEFIKKPKTAPLTKSPNLRLVGWEITTRHETLTGEKIKPYVERASAMFREVINNHAGTPWAARAEVELKRGYGVQLVEDYDAPDRPVPPGEPLIPVPKL
ncbi:MAG TPA: hypothetical protein VMP01_01870 [Pirellulaceae bacterium]|nr:hypothetical protein [Pirellulaceae bacterium]